MKIPVIWKPYPLIGHDKKYTYADAPIDRSFWHADGDEALLHPDDRENPIWNEDALQVVDAST